MRILVTGGTGFVGRHLGAALLAAGHEVVLLGRFFVSTTPLLEAGAHKLAVDLRDRAAVTAACAGMEAVYHVGALSAPWGRRADFEAVNVGGTAHVLEGCRLHQVRRLIFVSSPSVVFDGRDQLEIDEAQPYPRRFASVYSETKKLAEDQVNQASAGGLAATILRPKAIFGPGDTTLLPRIIAAARLGRLPQIGSGTNLVDLTYVENVVDALLLALDSQAAVGQTFHITNDEHVSLWAVIRSVLERLAIPAQLRRISLSTALIVARILELRAALTGREPLLTRYSAAILGRTQTYDIAAARQRLGYAPRVSVAEGIERTLAQSTFP